MIRLDATTRKLQVVLAGAVTANQLPIMVCWSDKTSTTYAGGTTLINSNNTTAVDICAAPGASTIRDIDLINIQNEDTASATVTVRYNDNATTYTLRKVTLSAGDQLTYVHGKGWSVTDNTGAVKTLSADLATVAGVQTLTNKRVSPRVGSTTSSATPTINTDLYDVYKLTAQTVDITSFTTNLSGTPAEDQPLIIKITGTAARAITWGASFEAGTFALPTTTITTAMLTVGFMWNSVTSKWRCMGAV